MSRFMKSSVLAFALSLAAATTALAQDDANEGPHLPADSMEIGRQYAEWFLMMEVDSLHAHMTEEQQARRTPDEMFELLTQMFTQVGNAGEMVSEKYVMRNGMPQYWYTTEFDGMSEPVQIRFVITPEGRIAGVGVNPESQAPPTDN